MEGKEQPTWRIVNLQQQVLVGLELALNGPSPAPLVNYPEALVDELSLRQCLLSKYIPQLTETLFEFDIHPNLKQNETDNIVFGRD